MPTSHRILSTQDALGDLEGDEEPAILDDGEEIDPGLLGGDGVKDDSFEEGDDRLQASNGPTPVKNRSPSPIGSMIVLNQGAATVTFTPCTHSESTGSIVPNRTAKHAATNSKLFSMKLLSREAKDSRVFSVRR